LTNEPIHQRPFAILLGRPLFVAWYNKSQTLDDPGEYVSGRKTNQLLQVRAGPLGGAV
jgi:hypothetical protein